MVFVYCWPWCGCQKRSVNLSWAWSRHWKTNAIVDSSQRLLDLNQEIGDEFFNFPGNKFGQKFLYVAVCVFIIVSQWSWPENPLQSDYIRWDWRCSEGCVLVLPYVRIDFSANQFYFALTKHKRAVCEVKFQTNPFLTQFTVIQKTKTTLSGAGTCTLSVKNDASRIETLIPQRNSFYEENVSKLRNVITVLFSAWIVACLCGYWLVKMFIFCGW